MAYLKQLRSDKNNPHNKYRRMRQLVNHAAAVCAGRAVLDQTLFGAIPLDAKGLTTEPDGSLTVAKEAVFAFGGASYGPHYGIVSARQQPKYLEPVERALRRWNNSLTNRMQSALRASVFRRLFLESGLWHVFIDRHDIDGELRAQLQGAADFSRLRKHETVLDAMSEAFPYFLRVAPGAEHSHRGSHFDVGRFASAVLHAGETELGLKEEGEKEQLLVNSLPEMRRRMTFLEITGVNRATNFMYDPARYRFRPEFLTISKSRLQVGLDMPAILGRIETELPNVASHNHYGCSVLYQETEYNGAQIPILKVMDETMIRLFRETGALMLPQLRVPL